MERRPNLFLVLRASNRQHWADAGIWLAYTIVGSLLPVWGGLFLLRLFSQESRSQSVTNARCRSEGSQSTLRVMQVAESRSSNPRAQPFVSAAVSLFFACRPTPPSSGQPSAAAHVER